MHLRVALVVSLVLSLFPWGKFALYPFKLFTTWVHECGHAVAALLVGGSVKSITIAMDTSGLTTSFLPGGVVARACVACAGYLGASAVGCLMLVAARTSGVRAYGVLGAIGALLLASAVFWVRNLFGWIVVLTMGAGLLALGRPHRGQWARYVLAFLAAQVALNALYDIRVLFALDAGTHSDAQTMASLFYLPASFWALLWMATSLGMFAMTLRRTRL